MNLLGLSAEKRAKLQKVGGMSPVPKSDYKLEILHP
jgi:hypothetical protein